MKIWMHCKANLRKSAGQTVTLTLFVLIAASLLHLGLSTFTGIGAFFDRHAEERRVPHVVAFYRVGGGADAGEEYFLSYPGVTETERLEIIGGTGQFKSGDVESSSHMILSRVYPGQRMDAPALLGESLPLTGDTLYLPNFMQENGGPRVGETFEANMFGVELNLTVAGATEEILMGAALNNLHRFYISDEKFDELALLMPEGVGEMLSVRLEDKSGADKLLADFGRDMPQEDVVATIGYDSARQARTTMAQVVAVFVAAFAAVLVIVCLIVVRFRIHTDIEESMVNIGALKAVGYTGGQILASVVLQFGLIALVGGALGLAAGQIFVPVFAEILKPQLALPWRPGLDAASALTTLALVLASVLLIAWLSARRIGRLRPLDALRGGIATHSFKRNALPLESARGPLGLLLALKQMAHNKRQAAMTALIMAAVTVAAVMGITLHYSMNVNREPFVRGFFGEITDATFVLKDGREGEAFLSYLQNRDDVRKAFGFENGSVLLHIDGTDNQPTVAQDSALLEGNMLLEGIYPRHDNEIALGSATSRLLDKGPGDMVTVEYGGASGQYVVTGIVQYTSYNGFNGMITGAGLLKLNPDFRFTVYGVYLRDGADAEAFIEDAQRESGDIFMSAGRPVEQVDGMLASMGSITAMVAAGIVAATVCVVILALYMLVKTTLLRRRRELGVQKALGFTTPQLMNQIALNLTPPVFLGIAAGAVAGCLGFSPMLTAAMSSLGVVKATLPIPYDWLAAACTALAVLTYGISLLLCFRIRKISAYALVSE